VGVAHSVVAARTGDIVCRHDCAIDVRSTKRVRKRDRLHIIVSAKTHVAASEVIPIDLPVGTFPTQ
jgi:hypothetical protein